MAANEILVFDTGPLSHFSRQNWLGALKFVVGERRALMPDIVVDELRAGAATDSRIQAALDAPWIEHRQLVEDTEIAEFARFSSFLVKKNRNRGEAAVLALTYTTNGVAIIDDGAARRTAERHGITYRPTLALLVDSIRQGRLSVELVSAIADDLLAGEYRLPFQKGDFQRWAKDNGLLPD